MTAAIELHQLHKAYPKLTALDGINLTIEQGEFFGLLGPNGAGKTTTISILAGLTRATSGRASVMGYDVQKDYQHARRALGVVPQELTFDPFFTVRETLQWQSGYFGPRHNGAWIDELLENLGLTDKADTNMRRLSGSMKRRVLVAQALVHRPPVIILDEPTAGVDVELRQSLWGFVSRLHQAGHTIVLTTHYLEEAEQLCGRIAMLKAGKIVALDKTTELLRQLAGIRMKLKLHQPMARADLPLLLRERLTGEYPDSVDKLQLQLAGPHEVETILSALRTADITIDDVGVSQADLEDVFIRMMQQQATTGGAA